MSTPKVSVLGPAIMLVGATIGFVGRMIACSESSASSNDAVFLADGGEADCGGAAWDRCVAANCLHGHELICWRDLSGGSTYRCKP